MCYPYLINKTKLRNPKQEGEEARNIILRV